MSVLEAMASGTPVITSNIGGTAEVAGKAALLVAPERVEEIAEAIRRLLSEAELRTACREQGLLRARCFTWERTARETIRVYQEVTDSVPQK